MERNPLNIHSKSIYAAITFPMQRQMDPQPSGDERSNANNESSLELFILQKLRKSPGSLDGRLHNSKGELYSQALHGENPLSAGFDIAASASETTISRTDAEQTAGVHR